MYKDAISFSKVGQADIEHEVILRWYNDIISVANIYLLNKFLSQLFSKFSKEDKHLHIELQKVTKF